MNAVHTARFLARSEVVALVALVLTALICGAAAAVIVPPGLPYDEPAHWSNVLFYARERALPVLGEEGVLYQAQQAPLYYAVAALIMSVVGEGGEGLLAVRLLGALGGAVVVGVTFFLLRAAVPRDRLVVATGTAFVALNPMLTVMAASVQNDSWALAAGFGAVLAAVVSRPWNSWAAGVAIGALSAAAILVKVSMAPLVVGIVAWLLLHRRVRTAVVATVVVAASTAWWFVRNLLLYGDATGQAGVEAAGFEFGTGGLSVDALARSVLTYLSVPTEYLRNTLVSPWWADVVLLVTAAAIAAGGVMLLRRAREIGDRAPLQLVLIVGAASVTAWLLQVNLGWQVAFRTAYGVIPLVALAYGGTTLLARRPLGRIAVACVACGLLLVLGAWVATALVITSPPAMLPF